MSFIAGQIIARAVQVTPEMSFDGVALPLMRMLVDNMEDTRQELDVPSSPAPFCASHCASHFPLPPLHFCFCLRRRAVHLTFPVSRRWLFSFFCHQYRNLVITAPEPLLLPRPALFLSYPCSHMSTNLSHHAICKPPTKNGARASQPPV